MRTPTNCLNLLDFPTMHISMNDNHIISRICFYAWAYLVLPLSILQLINKYLYFNYKNATPLFVIYTSLISSPGTIHTNYSDHFFKTTNHPTYALNSTTYKFLLLCFFSSKIIQPYHKIHSVKQKSPIIRFCPASRSLHTYLQNQTLLPPITTLYNIRPSPPYNNNLQHFTQAPSVHLKQETPSSPLNRQITTLYTILHIDSSNPQTTASTKDI